MPLKLTCPNCGTPTRVSEPYPLPGVEIQCVGCATAMSVTYPPGVMDLLRKRGKTFMDDEPAPLPASRHPVPDRTPPLTERSPTATPPSTPRAADTSPSDKPTTIDRPEVRQVDLPPVGSAPQRARPMPSVPAFSTSEPVQETPPRRSQRDAETHGARPTASVEIKRPRAHAPPPQPTSSKRPAPPPPPPAATEPVPTPDITAPTETEANPPLSPASSADRPRKARKRRRPTAAAHGGGSGGGESDPPKKKKGSFVWRWTKRLGCMSVVAAVLLVLAGAGTAGGAYWYYSQELPSVDALQQYEPHTVTEVYDRNGVLMGELYEQRRYVTPLEDIPPVVQNAFIAAEDAKFRDHGGVDYIGLVRAVINEATGGEKRQGASTITMQVTRNFLLTRDKTYERKIKEIILAQRIESVYDKDRILWLYLNELYLGSGAYGVEAAARVYFGKHANELTAAEAALVAGLAPAPSAYSPHKNWKKARTRQLYVLDRMRKNEFLTEAEFQAAKDEHITIVKEENPFLTTAPHFTEHVRRHIVDTYGFDRVYNEGLIVTTTMDLEVQQTAQNSVQQHVHEVDQRMGFRRAGLETLTSDAAIEARRAEHEQAMKQANAFEADPAGREPEPDTSILEPGRVYDGVILEVDKGWAKVGIGSHEAIIPLAWSRWVYEPNPRMSWRYRTANDLTATVRGWEEGVDKGGTLLRRGDVVLVKVEALSTTDPQLPPKPQDWPEWKDDPLTNEAVTRAFRKTPGADKAFVAARLWQEPQVEAATMSFDLHTGAVRAMVGGADFEKSEFNRATQARRQVGSTFKPIVYAAAIDTERLTAASIVPDVRGASYTTDAGFVWKPDNYGDEYLGNITLRRALALSKNTCTIKVLESMDPGMNDDVLYTFARKLGIGGPPAHTLPEGHVAKPDNDHLCPWTRETRESTICMDRFPPKDPDISNTRHRMQMGPDEVYMCRSCDMSMGLGSASLTMEELLRAYSAFPSGGKLVEPYYIEKVEDRDGNVLEQHDQVEFPEVIRPEVAYIATWLLENVVNTGTGAQARRALKMRLGGKTGTTQDFKDTWFVGFSNDVITAAWVGYDEPQSLGVSSTGGRTALPIWIDVMRKAAPKEKDRPFKPHGNVDWAQIDEDKGTRVTSGGRRYPFIPGTAPESTGVAAGEYTVDDLTEL